MTDREKFEAWFKSNMHLAGKCFVDEQTKRRLWSAWQAALASRDDGWIEWAGGDQPVEDYLLVETKWTDGSISYGEASRWRWSHKSLLSDNNLIAYRVVKP